MDSTMSRPTTDQHTDNDNTIINTSTSHDESASKEDRKQEPATVQQTPPSINPETKTETLKDNATTPTPIKQDNATPTPIKQDETTPTPNNTTPNRTITPKTRLGSVSGEDGGLEKMSKVELKELFLKQRQATLRYKGRFTEV